MLRRLVAVSLALAAAGAWSPAAAEEMKPASGYWSMSLAGGAAFPLADYAADHEQALGAHAALGYTGASGLGLAVHAGYSPLPVGRSEQSREVRDNHVVHAALAPRFTLGRNTLRLFLGGGGGVYFEQRAETRTAPAALAQAGLELHVLGAGGLTLGGSYVRTFADAAAQLASAHAGFVLTF